jgi:hypothetical protein
MAITNRIENSIISAITAVFTIACTVAIIHFATIKPLQQQIEKQNQVIVELAKIEKYKIQNDFGKIKPRDGSQIILDLDNSLNALELETMPQDTVMVDQKTFWQKLKFWKK